ncbi:MAG: ParB/RepB/Spo0J family partition protein [Anaerolineales bacterium]
MSRRRGLGRGLDALIPSSIETESTDIVQLDVDQIGRNPRQPRRNFEASELEELANSIREHGVLQPLMVARPEGSDDLVLIAGERRLQAAKQAGLATVPAILREASDEQLLVWALIENLQREDLNAIEAAEGYRQLADDFGLSHEAIGERVGKSRSTISNALRLLNLPDSIQDAIDQGAISEGHARALLGLPTEQAQLAALETVRGRGLNVRQTEELVRRLSGKRKPKTSSPRKSPETKALEEELRQALGTKVNVHAGKQGGTITLHFYSDEELNALIDRLLEGNR